jgi:hypothetical protein
MRILTPEEFKKLYGENSVAGFSTPSKPPTYTRQETNQDRIEMGTSLQKTLDISNQERLATRARVTSGEIGVIEGTAQTIGQGLFRGGEFLGNTALGLAKMALPEDVEQRVRETLGKELQNLTDPEKAQAFVSRLENSEGGLLVSGDFDKAVAEDIKDFNYKIQNDPNFKANVLSTVGYAQTLTSLLTAPSKVKTPKVGSPDIPKVTVGEVPSVKPLKVEVPKLETPKVTPDEVMKQATKLREDVRAYVGEKSVDPQVKASAERLVTQQDPAFLKGTAKRTEDVETKYNRYLTQSENAINDIKVDPAIAEVGSKMGNAFENVIKQRQAVGAVLGKELDEWGKLRVSIKGAIDETLADLDGSGLSYNPRTRQLTSFQGSRFVPQEVTMLNDFVSRAKLLGDAPTVRQIDQFIARTRTALEFTKGESGVLGVTNAERIINGAVAKIKDSLNPNKNGIQQLSKYWEANKTYSSLSDFIDDGATFLGKKTQSGDFAKDASIAKSAVQSILNSGKKDWMLKLEALTGYNALDDAVLALQAMKDAGDFRGLSLLQAMKDSGVPTSKAGFTGALLDKAVDIGKRVVAGTPAEQTRAFLKSLKKTGKKVDLKVPDKKVAAPKNVPKTKEIITLEKKIAKNVDSQKAAIKIGDFELVAKLKEVYSKLVTEIKTLIKEVVDAQKNPQIGQKGSVDFFAPLPKKSKIPKTVTPESVAKKSAPEDIKFLAAVIDDVKGARISPEANKILDAMGLGKATDGELVSFAKEVIDEADIAKNLEVKATTLLEEAKKYKSAEEFVKAQGTPLFHGTTADFTDFKQSKSGEIGKGVYFYDSKTRASDHTGGRGRVIESYVNGKMATMDEFRAVREELGDVSWTNSDTIDELARRGYVGIVRPEGNSTVYNVFDPKNIKTKESLEAVWKRANQ